MLGDVCDNARLVPKGLKEVNVGNVVKFTNQLKARDKLLRLVQYSCKGLVYRMLQDDPKNQVGLKLQLLAKGVSLHRKAFKLGAWLDEYEKFMDALKKKQCLKQQLQLALRFCLGVFVWLDNLVYFVSLKVVTSLNKDALKLKAYRFRLVGAILNTILGAMDMQEQQKVVEKAGPEDKLKAEEKQGQNIVGMVKNVADVITYCNSAEVFKAIFGSGFNDGVIGAVGATSSAAALYGIWAKMK